MIIFIYKWLLKSVFVFTRSDPKERQIINAMVNIMDEVRAKKTVVLTLGTTIDVCVENALLCQDKLGTNIRRQLRRDLFISTTVSHTRRLVTLQLP